MAVLSLIVVAVVAVILYRTCAAFPSSALVPSSLFANSGSDDSKDSDDERVLDDESPWDRAWRSASDPDLPEEKVEEGKEVAAREWGGEFAGLHKPGRERIRAPQVLTRPVALDLTVALSRLPPLSESTVTSNPLSSSMGNSDEPLRDVKGANISDGEVEKPVVDLMFVFDASDALPWKDYRDLKESFTNPGGLLDDLMNNVGPGSRVGFVEYAYDALVVSELDSNQDVVRRRILGAFQGDANNWERGSMFIYEVDETQCCNALRKISSVTEQEAGQEKKLDESDALWDIEHAPKVSAKEVPAHMNYSCREAHLALKWAQYEMLPPVANKEVLRKLERTNRLRRILFVNAGPLTASGDTGGLTAAKTEIEAMKERGIEVVTLGVGPKQDPDLGKLYRSRRQPFVSLSEVAEVESKQAELVARILNTGRAKPNRLLPSEVAVVLRKLFPRKTAKDAHTRKAGVNKSRKRVHVIAKKQGSYVISPVTKGREHSMSLAPWHGAPTGPIVTPRRGSDVAPWFNG